MFYKLLAQSFQIVQYNSEILNVYASLYGFVITYAMPTSDDFQILPQKSEALCISVRPETPPIGPGKLHNVRKARIAYHINHTTGCECLSTNPLLLPGAGRMQTCELSLTVLNWHELAGELRCDLMNRTSVQTLTRCKLLYLLSLHLFYLQVY